MIIKIAIIFFITVITAAVIRKITEIIKVGIYKRRITQNKNTEILKNLGFIYLKQKKYKEAEKCFETAVKENDVQGFSGLGALYIILKEYDKAEEYLKKALEKNCTMAMNNLGALYYIQGKYEKSVEYYKMAVKNGYKKSGKMLGKLQAKSLNNS